MNYKNIYNNIIINAQSQTRSKGNTVYYESHHIIPKSLKGSDHYSNLVLLTAKEHFVCHHLLHKIHGGKMTYAFHMMCVVSDSNQQRYIPSAIVYEQLKPLFANLQRIKWTENNPNNDRDVTGSNNPMYGSSRCGEDNPFFGKTHSKETKKKISDAKLGINKGAANTNFKGFVHTPVGIFDSYTEAAKTLNCDRTTVRNRCNNAKFPDYHLSDSK